MTEEVKKNEEEAQSETDSVEADAATAAETESAADASEATDNQEASGDGKSEVDTLKELLMRERAEFQNYKRRTSHEMAHFRGQVVSNFISDFLNVFDNLELVLNQKTGDLDSFLTGVEMIRKEFLSSLEKHNIHTLDPVGEAFDPTRMEAFLVEESADVSEETVSEVFQKGFVLKKDDTESIVRTARVKIQKPAAGAQNKDEGESKEEQQSEENVE